MKKLALLLCVLLMLSVLCSCEKNVGDEKDRGTADGATEATEDAIPDGLLGTWYGPANQPALNVNADGTGEYSYFGVNGEATYTADEKNFTANGGEYTLSGEYTLDGDTLTVKGEGYDTVLTRAKKTLDPEIVGTWYFGEEDNITVVDYGPDGSGKKKEPPGTTLDFYYETRIGGEIIYVTPHAPEEKGKYTAGVTPEITPPGEPDTSVQMWNGGSIVGTWLDPEIAGSYTLNADGTGSFTALGGLVTGTITYTYEDNILSLTVVAHALGQTDTESGSGYVRIEGDTLYSYRGSGAPLALSRVVE